MSVSTALFQIEEEIKGCLHFLQYVYSTFGFSFQLNLSTRPEHFLGEVEMWDEAERVSTVAVSHAEEMLFPGE